MRHGFEGCFYLKIFIMNRFLNILSYGGLCLLISCLITSIIVLIWVEHPSDIVCKTLITIILLSFITSATGLIIKIIRS